MESLSKWVIGTFATPFGLIVLAFLDSTLFFNLPFGIDVVIIIVAARHESLAWTVPLLATVGSLAGAALTFWIGAKAGEAGLERYVPARRLDRVRRKVRGSGAMALAVLNVIPPPFPFTMFVIAAGALKVKRLPFFATFAVTRFARFALEAFLAVRYGGGIIGWLDAPAVQYVVVACIAVAAVLTTVSVYQLFRSSRPRLA